jgi:hypothetical protein
MKATRWWWWWFDFSRESESAAAASRLHRKNGVLFFLLRSKEEEEVVQVDPISSGSSRKGHRHRGIIESNAKKGQMPGCLGHHVLATNTT